MTAPKVSVILAVYNAGKYLIRCMDSVINQTLRDIEIICVDDGSTDNSLILLQQYAEQDSRIRVIVQENQGAGAARNTGLFHACGEYLSFLDSDDFFEPTMLEKAYEKAMLSDADIVVFGSDHFLEENESSEEIPWAIQTCFLPAFRPFSRQDLSGNVFKVFVGWAWDKLIRSDFVKKNHLTFQEIRTSNDMRFTFLCVILAERIDVDPAIYAHHRRNISTSLSNTREKSWHCFHDALCSIRRELIERDLFEELEQDYINYTLHASLWNLTTITGPKKAVLYQKLKAEWFQDFGITGKPAAYFYDQNEYRRYRHIKSMNYSSWMLFRKIAAKIRER